MTYSAISGIAFLVMQTRTKLLSKLVPMIGLVLLLVLGLVVGMQRLRHPVPTQEPVPVISAENPRATKNAATAQTQVQEYKTEYTPSDAIETVRASQTGWNFKVFGIDDKQALKAGGRRSPSSAKSDTELAEAHNMLRMRSYQDRVIRQLNSTTPVLPVRYAPPLDETIWPAVPPVQFTPTFREQRFEDSGGK